MQKSITDMLGLQGFLVDRIETIEGQSIVHCRSPKKFVPCPICQASTKKIHQKTYRKIRHGKINDLMINLHVLVRRLKCKSCHKVFTEKINGISRVRCTDAFYRLAFELLAQNSFRWVAKYCGISPATLVKKLVGLQSQWVINWEAMGDWIILGIDEHSFRGKRMVITITDLRNKKLLAVLKGDKQSYLEEFINSIPKSAQKRIIEACTDMRFSFRSVIEKMLPNVDLVADRFHVEQQAKIIMDQIRSAVQDSEPKKFQAKKLFWSYSNQLDARERKKLDWLFEKYQKYPSLKEMWIIKEQIRQIYFSPNKKTALQQFNHCIMLLETAHYSIYINQLRKTLIRWKPMILNYFNHRTTNGFTEGCHTKIKMMKRVSFGFRNINNYIAKMTLAFIPLLLVLNHHTI